MRCVLCGKEFSGTVRLSHLKSHDVDRDTYNNQAKTFSDVVWEFYWTHPQLQKLFPSPMSTTPREGMELTFSKWLKKPSVLSKNPELIEE